MAQYKYAEFLKQSSAPDFDALYTPGAPVPHAGIYRCIACGDEIGIARGQTLPPPKPVISMRRGEVQSNGNY